MPQKPEDRNYKKEYREYHSKPKQKKNRAKRNKARREMAKKGRVSKGDGKEVDHKVPLSKGGSNDASNWGVMSRSANRRKGSSGRSTSTTPKPSTSSGKRVKRRTNRKYSRTRKKATGKKSGGSVEGPKSIQKKINL